MAENDKTDFRDGYTELRVPAGFCSDEIHRRIERWRDIHNLRTGDKLNKAEAVVALLDKATKHIKLPQVAWNGHALIVAVILVIDAVSIDTAIPATQNTWGFIGQSILSYPSMRDSRLSPVASLDT